MCSKRRRINIKDFLSKKEHQILFEIILKEKFNQANKYKAYEVTIEKCKEQNLMQAAYFIERNLSFTRDV